MPRMVRDVVLFVAGLLGVVHETLIQEEVRAELLMIFAAMLGLPLFLRSDEQRDPPQIERRSTPRKKDISLEDLVRELEKRAKMVVAAYRNSTVYLTSALLSVAVVSLV